MIKTNKTYTRLDYHIVFGTKYREQSIDNEIISRVRDCAKEKAEELGFLVHIVNGYKDHIHILMTLPPKYAVAHIVKHIKGYSSRMIEGLRWQNGYSAFTVDESSFDRVFQYIKMQQKDHEEEEDTHDFPA